MAPLSHDESTGNAGRLAMRAAQANVIAAEQAKGRGR